MFKVTIGQIALPAKSAGEAAHLLHELFDWDTDKALFIIKNLKADERAVLAAGDDYAYVERA